MIQEQAFAAAAFAAAESTESLGLALISLQCVDGDVEAQTSLLRDVFGNPFLVATVDPDWLFWNDCLVGKLAQAIYDERAFGDLPILADALEDSGCSDTAILEHCREELPHVRGCWVVDLILGKD